jgi:hypothetical protein
MNVSNPLKIVIIPVLIKANQAPYGCNGALYGRVSLEIPATARAFMKRLTNMCQRVVRDHCVRLHVSVNDGHLTEASLLQVRYGMQIWLTPSQGSKCGHLYVTSEFGSLKRRIWEVPNL